MSLKKIITIIIFFIFFILIIIYNLMADTGYYFAYDYIKNKIENDFTDNQVIVENNNINIVQNQKYNFENIVGIQSEFIEIDNSIIPTKNQIFESNKWTRSNGGEFSNKFANLNDINIKNINNLTLDFKINFNNSIFKKNWKNNVETNPIFYDGLLYVVTPFKELLAINIIEKKIEWRFKSLKRINSRGMTLWINKKNQNNSCIIIPIRNGIFCINYKTGKLNKEIGKGGFVKTGIVKAAPVVWEDYIVVATVDDQKIKYIALNNGNIKYEIDIHPLDRKFKGGSPWGGISLDSKNNLLFLTTGNPRPALIGSTRPGPNKNTNSLIAFDLKNQKISWTFQEVSHDLWDYDLASPPLLTSIRFKNMEIDVVIVTSKIGNTFIFDRVTGKSLHDIIYKKVPSSDFINEQASLKQPFVNFPDTFMKLNFEKKDIDKRNLKEYEELISKINNYNFGIFTPPSFSKDTIVYGLHGGAQWPGAVFDPYYQNLILPVNQIPWLLRLYVTSNVTYPSNMEDEYKLYISNCSSCHKEKRQGNYKTVDEKNINFVPNLIKIYENNYNNINDFNNVIVSNHENTFDKLTIVKIFELFKEWDKKIELSKDYKTNYQWSQFLYSDDLPVSNPPWGKIVSINLSTGKINWEVPNGYIYDKKIGTSNFGGLIATSGGLIFVTGTNDKKILALDSFNGNEIWSYSMSAAGSTAPITFELNNKQYLAVISSGGRYHNYTKKYGELYVFSLQ